jgi:hypothetical protein
MLVEYCIRLAHIGSALNKDQVLSLTEDAIHGTCLAQNFASFKQQRKLSNIYHNENSNQQKVIVGNGWYSNFMRRNEHLIMRQQFLVKD